MIDGSIKGTKPFPETFDRFGQQLHTAKQIDLLIYAIPQRGDL